MLTKTSAWSYFDWQCWKQIQGFKSYKMIKTQAIALMLTDDSCIQWKHQNCTLPNDIIGTREQLERDKHQTPHAACTNQIPLHHFFFQKAKNFIWWRRRRWQSFSPPLSPSFPALLSASPLARMARRQSSHKQESKQRNSVYRSLDFIAASELAGLVSPLHYTWIKYIFEVGRSHKPVIFE